MHELLSQQSHHAQSAERLQRLYDQALIPPEKKPFLIDSRRCTGPFLAVEDGPLICDGASQIASLGLGFNAGALFGAAEYLESWTNQTVGGAALEIRAAYERLLKRKLGSTRYFAHFCASGAEAVESTLSFFFDRRPHPDAIRVLAFEGAFHGRMMVALASTWNPKKREPFAWPGYQSIFAPYPEMDDDRVRSHAVPAIWKQLWTSRSEDDFRQLLTSPELDAADGLVQKEINSLTAARAALATGKVYAILIEPMQCEGGERYASSRFHQGLVYLSRTFGVPLVYDEIQTGFGLGGEFFWHRMFELVDELDQPYFPDGIICAKKAQTGVSIVRDLRIAEGEWSDSSLCAPEQVSAASLVRGLIQASVIDQFRDALDEMESRNRTELARLVERFHPHVTRPRAKGVAFAFDLKSPELIEKLVANRFNFGLLYYPAGVTTARFRLNLGYREPEMRLFWDRLKAAVASTLYEAGVIDATHASIAPPDHLPDIPSVDASPKDVTDYYAFHEQFIDAKLRLLRGEPVTARESVLTFLRDAIAANCDEEGFEVVLLDASSYPKYRESILQVQAEVYEPARQTSAAEFDALFASDQPLSIVVLKAGKIVAMGFAGPIGLFKHQRGVTDDPFQDDPSVAYMVDLTVDELYRGFLGRLMKQAMLLLAQSSGVTAIHGRNRDRLAAGMWSINLSLGSYPLQHLVDDYPDKQPFRDCIYYRCPTVWENPPLDLSSAIESPLSSAHLDSDFVRDNIPVVVNKITLSNFVPDSFLRQLEYVATLFPEGMRHFYTANGLSEGVDKIAKVLWKHRQPRMRMVSIEGHDFGHGSFLSRSLSGIGNPFFRVDTLAMSHDAVSNEADDRFFERLGEELASDELLGVFVEPTMRRTMTKVPPATLEKIVSMCRANGVPIVFNETASLCYRYAADSFTAGGPAALRPDAMIAYLGGQMALVATSTALFIDEPLLLISTWEGDAFSLAQFQRAAELIQTNKSAYLETMLAYHKRLTALLDPCRGVAYRLERGIGMVMGEVPSPLRAALRSVNYTHRISCPSYGEMVRFLAAES